MTSSSVSEPASSYRVESGLLFHVFILTHTRPFGYLVSDPFTKCLYKLLACMSYLEYSFSKCKTERRLDVFEVPIIGNTVRCICRQWVHV